MAWWAERHEVRQEVQPVEYPVDEVGTLQLSSRLPPCPGVRNPAAPKAGRWLRQTVMLGDPQECWHPSLGANGQAAGGETVPLPLTADMLLVKSGQYLRQVVGAG